jgi:hypothetical protein
MSKGNKNITASSAALAALDDKSNVQLAPPPKTLSKVNIGVAFCEVNLSRPKDIESEQRQDRASTARDMLEQHLTSFYPCDPDTAQFFLHARVTMASEGSRKARIWAAELGHGHAKFAARWVLTDKQDNVISSNFIMETSDAGCGAADLYQSDAGDRALEIMARTGAEKIIQAIQALGGSSRAPPE